MKKFSVLALVLAFVMMFSVVSFAAETVTYSFKAEGPAVYPDKTEVTGTTVTTAVNTDNFKVSTATADGNYYGILLVKGDALPTVDNAILYIDQLTADGTAEEFTVKPIVPTAGEKLTLYISSNAADAKLISIPMVYSADKAAYTLGNVTGDVDENGKAIINVSDAIAIINYILYETPFGDLPVEVGNVTGDVDENGKAIINVSDAIAVINYILYETEF